MITLREACTTISNMYPDKRILGCMDCRDSYAFSVVTRKWDGESLDTEPTSPTLEAVRKSDGTTYGYHMMEILMNEPDANYVDISSYLSSEDVEFINKIKKLKEV